MIILAGWVWMRNDVDLETTAGGTSLSWIPALLKLMWPWSAARHSGTLTQQYCRLQPHSVSVSHEYAPYTTILKKITLQADMFKMPKI